MEWVVIQQLLNNKEDVQLYINIVFGPKQEVIINNNRGFGMGPSTTIIEEQRGCINNVNLVFGPK